MISLSNSEKLKYEQTFLVGDLNLFREVRKEQNKDREPYKIHIPDEHGKY